MRDVLFFRPFLERTVKGIPRHDFVCRMVNESWYTKQHPRTITEASVFQ
jgi:hypothetical protein